MEDPQSHGFHVPYLCGAANLEEGVAMELEMRDSPNV